MPMTGVPKARVGEVVQSYITRDNAAYVGAQREAGTQTYTVGPMSGMAGAGGGSGSTGGGGGRAVAASGGGRTSASSRLNFTDASDTYKPSKRKRKASAGRSSAGKTKPGKKRGGGRT